MKAVYAALLVAAVVIAIGIGAWLVSRGDKPAVSDAPPPAAVVVPPVAAPSPSVPPIAVAPPQPPAPAPTAATRPPALKPSGAPGVPSSKPIADQLADVRADIDNISLMFRDFRTLMGDNPVGSNAEIMKAVSGGNPRQARLGPPEGQQLNASGELVDAWGTPYFFHQMSSTHMDIQSAGPDKKHGTPDDIKGR